MAKGEKITATVAEPLEGLGVPFDVDNILSQSLEDINEREPLLRRRVGPAMG